MLWLTDYLPDLESDFSAIHRVDDIYSMDAPRFFRFAVRLTAYEGVLAARRMQEEQRGGSVSTRQGATEVPLTHAAMSADPVLASIVSWEAGK